MLAVNVNRCQIKYRTIVRKARDFGVKRLRTFPLFIPTFLRKQTSEETLTCYQLASLHREGLIIAMSLIATRASCHLIGQT